MGTVLAAGSDRTGDTNSGVVGTGSCSKDGREGLGWSVTSSVVFLESIGPGGVFFDGMPAGCK